MNCECIQKEINFFKLGIGRVHEEIYISNI